MKKLFITAALLFFFINANSQEDFCGNWIPENIKNTVYSKNINILMNDCIIWTYASKLDWINHSKENPEFNFDVSKYKIITHLQEYITHIGKKEIKSIVYNRKNNYRVFITYRLKNKETIIAIYTGDWKGKITYKKK